MNLKEIQKAGKRTTRRGPRGRLTLAIVAFVGVLAMVAGGSAASAQTSSNPDDWKGAAFLLAHDSSITNPNRPTSPGCYEPLPENSANTSLRENSNLPFPAPVNRICRTRTGRYDVTLNGFDSPGVVHVNALEVFAPQGRTCKVESQDNSTKSSRSVPVNCYDSSGNPADAQFNLTFTNREPATGTFGYLTTDGNGPWGCRSVPLEGQYHATGGRSSVCSFISGIYTVNLPAQASTFGNVQVTAVGAGSTRCKADSWWFSSITVRCHQGETLTTSDFSLTYVGGAGGLLGGDDCCFLGSETAGYAYVWDATFPSYQMQAPSWTQYNGAPTFGVEVTNGPTGQHSTRFFSSPGYASSETAMVTAVGTGSEYCNLNNWSDDRVAVNCFDASGQLVSTPHNVAMNSAWRR